MAHGAAAYGQIAYGGTGTAAAASGVVSPIFLGSTASIFTPSLIGTVKPSLLASGAQVFSPSLGMFIQPAFLASTAQVFAPALAGAVPVIGTTTFPSQVDFIENLLTAANNAASTLVFDISNSALSLTLVDASSFPSSGAITLDLAPIFATATSSEVVYYSGKVSHTLTLTARARDGTTAKAFTAGARVELRNVARHHNIHSEAIVAVEAELLSVGSQVLSRALLGHLHPISDTINLQSGLDGLQTNIDGKAATGHGHVIAGVTGLQTALDAKAVLSHVHVISDTTGLQAQLDAKALLSHPHIIADVTGLQAALAAGLGWFNVKAYGAVGDGVASDRAAIQSAIDACPVFGTVYFPSGTYLLSGSGAELLLVTKNINLLGEHGAGAILLVASSVGATVDVIRIAGTTQHFHQQVRGLHVKAQSGTPGRHTLALDVNGTGNTGHQQFQMQIVGNRFERMNTSGRSIILNFPSGTDGFFCSSIVDNLLERGVSLLRCGDTVTIARNTFWWRGDADAGACTAIDLSTVTGAAKVIVKENNCTLSGGLLRVLSCLQLTVEENQVEQVVASSMAESAQIALIGSTARLTIPRIISNNLNGHSNCNYNVYIDACDQPIIEHNSFANAVIAAVRQTSNCANAAWNYNPGSSISDAGTGTVQVSYIPLP